MLSAYLQSRVARRLFGLFLVATLLPVALLGLFSYTLVRDHLIDLSQQRLHHESKAFGMELVGRLRQHADELVRLANQGTGVDPVRSDAGSGFSGFVRLPANELRMNDTQRRHLQRGGVVLTSDDIGHLSLTVGLASEPSLLQGALRTGALWKVEDAGILYCVLSPAAETYHCSPELQSLPLSLSLSTTAHSGVFELKAHNEVYLAAYWRAQLQGTFASPGFIVVTLHPQKEILAVLTRFRQVFPAVMVLALLVAAWLSMGQIRRQMRPLHQLSEGAQRVSHGNFDTEVKITNDDEFGTLGAAFNLMTLRLKQKFHLLGALGELDKAILSASEMEYVVQTVLAQIPNAVSCDYLSVMQSDTNFAVGPGWLTYRAVDGKGEPVKADIYLDELASAMLQSGQPCLRLDPAQPGAGFLQPLAVVGLRSAWVFPAASDGRLSAIFILGFKVPPEETEDMAKVGSSIADRLAVAGSNIAWEEKLYHNAHYDALTNLPNRVLLRDRVAQAINRARRDHRAVALMLLDLDHFKEVNDSLGHSVGDKLLAEVAQKLADQVRESDTVARLGGDEFVILLTDLERGNETTTSSLMAEKLISTLGEPIVLEGRTFSVQASIGIALYPDNAQSFEEMLQGADAAMYESKRKQRGGYRFYSQEINDRVRERSELIQDLRLALERGEFLLYYQPKVETRSGRIVGAEALIRWQSPSRGLVPPNAFIHLTEEIGLGDQLGDWVLHSACAQLAEWDRRGMPPITVSVNVSPSQFLESDFVTSVFNTLAAHGLPRHRLELEILETTAMDTSVATRGKLKALREHDVHIALDDFGTGYSSLVYLTQIPANVLKLDREFIRSLAVDRRQAATVAGIIALAKSLEIQVVAEGVEEQAQWKILEEIGCDLIQGYLFSRPLPAEDFAKLLDTDLAALSEGLQR